MYFFDVYGRDFECELTQQLEAQCQVTQYEYVPNILNP